MNPTSLLVVPPGLGTARRQAALDPGQPFVAGRAAGADLVLADPRVSSRHARFLRTGDGVSVEDLGSLNGTFLVAGGARRRLEPGEAVPLPRDAAVEIGPFLVVPCAALSDDVLVHDALDPRDFDPSPGPDGEPAVQPAGDETRVAQRLAALPADDPWPALLEAALDVAGASRGTLLARHGERMVVRAAVSPVGPACIGERFLAHVLAQPEAFAWHPAPGDPGASLLSVTLGPGGPGAALCGIPFRAGGQIVAAAVLEAERRVTARACASLTLLAAAAAPLLGARLDLERERRRREALEAGGRTAREPRTADTALIGASPAFRAAQDALERAAGARTTVLLRGPSGSGKEEAARLLHRLSPRRDQPFVVVNAAAVPESLLESELFGHDRGAFTGADALRAGAFERADGGTLFLDEIGDLPASAQAKILRAVESGEVVRVGGSRVLVDVRLCTATHRDLEAMVRAGTFRSDLYYRLRVVEVALPSLAQRAGDVLPLCAHFLARFRRPDGTTVAGPTPQAARALVRYAWPGNVRELRNVIERAVVLDRDGVLDVDDLPADLVAVVPVESSAGTPPGDDLFAQPWTLARDRFEALYFERLLARCEGRVLVAAREADVDRRTLSTKIRQWGLRSTTR